MAELAPEHVALFQGKNFAAFGTIRADGTPHVSPVWIDSDGEYVTFNTSKGRAKEKQVLRTSSRTSPGADRSITVRPSSPLAASSTEIDSASR